MTPRAADALRNVLLRLERGPCIVDFARVCAAGEVLCVGGAQLHGDHLLTVVAPAELNGLRLILVPGACWVPLDADVDSLVFFCEKVPMGNLARCPYPSCGACGCCKLEG